MYAETDFLTALLKDDDWLQEAAIRALDERDDIHTSILAYAEVLVLFYDRETAEQFKHCANTASELCWHGRRQIPQETGCQPETRRVSGDDGYGVTSEAKAS